MTISFDSVVLDGSGSQTNFPAGYPTVLNTSSTVYNSPSRTGGIVVTDLPNSVPFSATYQILTGGRTEYNAIKAKEGTVGTLVIESDSIDNVILMAVSTPTPLGGGGALRCSLQFELTEV